ncbi:hypothetical protein I4U23_017495 [Adineta vaga]|nr:hypothetical protein I4U23_017495 [Adineta vaga]
MSHFESSTLARYNSLADPHLQSYFSNERIQSHLKHAGLVTNHGEILSDAEYRSKLAQREHRKHVRHMLAENIVNRAIDIERSRNAEVKRYFETVSKAALVNNIKESRRRHAGGNSLGFMSGSSDMALLSLDSSWAQSRPRSANYHSDFNDEHTHIPRIQSANLSLDRRIKHSSKSRKRRPRSLQRPKSSQKPRSSTKYPNARSSSPPCQIQMIYYGPHTKVDYDRMVFSDIDEVMVMQQHCGGENLIVYKGLLKPGAEFTFDSRRHSDYPFGLSLYVKGLIDSRISTCCEYKHRHGVRLGGDRGHFAVLSVVGSKPCIKCRYGKQALLKKYAESPKEKKEKTEKPLTVSVNVSDEPKNKAEPVQIPIRHTSVSINGSDSSVESKKTSKRSSKSSELTPKVAPRASRPIRKVSSEKSDTTYDVTRKDDSTKKTWQVIFHPTSIATGNFRLGSNGSSKRFFLKLSFIVDEENIETESYEIDMKPFIEHSRSAKPYSIPIKFRNIGKPEQIRLNMSSTQDEDEDEDDRDDIKWHLDHIEVIDPETHSHYIFPCKTWIHRFQEKYLQLSQERVNERSSARTNDSRSTPSPKRTRQASAKVRQQSKTSSRSSTPTNSPKPLKTQQKPSQQTSSDDEQHIQYKPKPLVRSSTTSNDAVKPSRRISTGSESNQSIGKTPQKPKVSSRSSTPTNPPKSERRKNSSEDESDQATPKIERKSSNNSTSVPTRKDSTQRSSPDSSERPIRFRVIIYPSETDDGEFNPTQHSRIFLRLNNHKKEVNLTRRSDQLCPTFESGVEQTFEVNFNQEKDEPVKTLTIGYVNTESQAKTWKIDKIVLINTETQKKTIFLCKESLQRNDSDYRAEKTYQVQIEDSNREDTPTNRKIKSSKDSDDEEEEIQRKNRQSNHNNKNEHERNPSFHSMKDDEANYKDIFRKLDPENTLDLGSPPRTPSPRPKTRRGEADSIERDDQNQPNLPRLRLDTLTNQSARSNDQDNQNSRSSIAKENPKSQYKQMYPTDTDNDDAEEKEEDDKDEHY